MEDKEKRQPRRVGFQIKITPQRILTWLLVIFLFIPFAISLFSPSSLFEQVSISQALTDIHDQKVQKISVQGDDLILDYGENNLKLSYKEEGSSMVEILQRAEIDPSKVNIEVQSQTFGKVLGSLLSNVLPIVIFAVILYFMTRQARGQQDSLFGFGKSRAKLFAKGKQNITFKDVAGVDEAKKELEEVVDFLKNPKKYKAVGARTPKGVLLVGPSGVGKTLLAKAVAGEANVPFFSMAGSEFMEMLVGVGASRVRDLFGTAKKAAPSIIFIDELDAIGRMRGVGGGMGGHDEREQTLNQILVEMDGFTANDNVIVMAATNRPDVLDPALVRPGRFDRRVMLDMPDIEGRKSILMIHAKNKPFESSLDWDKVSKRTVGFSGADLENMLNEAAIQAARRDRKKINMEDIEEAATRVKLGPEKKRLQSERERKMTAFHEAGHAVVAHMLGGADRIHRVSIVSRGMALGFTMTPPERDKYQNTKTELIDQLAMAMGGRAAEMIFFNELTAGASNDIERATRMARRMVTDFGMSDLGPMAMGPMYENTEWGGAMMEPDQVSEGMKAKIDDEVRKILDTAMDTATKVLTENKKKAEDLVEVLLNQETVEGEEFEKIMGVAKAENQP